MKKIIVMSDLHAMYKNIILEEKEVDILISTGDVISYDNMNGVINFLNWFEKLEAKNKIIIAGNGCGVWIEKEEEFFYKECKKRNIIYLCDEFVIIEGYKIYGTPWTIKYGQNNGYAVDSEEELKEKFEKIPNDTDILLTHMPPYGILDKNYKGINSGSISLKNKIINSKIILSCFGHIHEANGIIKKNQTIFVNSSYNDKQPFYIIELES